MRLGIIKLAPVNRHPFDCQIILWKLVFAKPNAELVMAPQPKPYIPCSEGLPLIRFLVGNNLSHQVFNRVEGQESAYAINQGAKSNNSIRHAVCQCIWSARDRRCGEITGWNEVENQGHPGQ